MTTKKLLGIIKTTPSPWWQVGAYNHFESTRKSMKPGDVYIWEPQRIDGIPVPVGYGYMLEITATGWSIIPRRPLTPRGVQ